MLAVDKSRALEIRVRALTRRKILTSYLCNIVFQFSQCYLLTYQISKYFARQEDSLFIIFQICSKFLWDKDLSLEIISYKEQASNVYMSKQEYLDSLVYLTVSAHLSVKSTEKLKYLLCN